jgi:hypothetical protein
MRWIISSKVSADDDLRVFVLSACAVLAFMLVFMRDAKVYDLSTASTFALGLGWMARGKLVWLFGSFPLMCVNRETAILLTAIFALYFWGRMDRRGMMIGAAYQLSVWGATRFFVTWMYGGNAGQDVYFRLWENLRLFSVYPPLTVLHWAAFAWVTWRVVRGWKLMPALVRCAWLVLFPMLMAEYIFAGFAFEVRVFAEAWPMVAFLFKDKI